MTEPAILPRLDVFASTRGKDYSFADVTYEQIVETFGTILAQASDDDYQGDSLYLVVNDGRVGILTFGWGSCSGCDALEAATMSDESAQKDVDDLQDDLARGIRWFDSLTEAREWLADPEAFKGSYINDDLLERFRAAVFGVGNE